MLFNNAALSRPRLALLALAGTLLCPGILTAQALVGTVVGQSATDLHNRCGGTNNRAIAAAADGSLWTILYRDDNTGSTTARTLRLWYSTNRGATWQGSLSVPTKVNGSIGALTIDRTCNVLHVVWAATDGITYYNAYYQAFDIATKAWIGTHQMLAKGYNSNNQFYVQDVAVTPKKTVVVAVNGHRSGGYGLGGWSTGLLVKKAGDAAFPPTNNTTAKNLLQMNTSSGTGCDLQVADEEIHCVFRDTPGGYGPRYSVFDTVTMQYTIKAVAIGPGNNTTPPAGGGSINCFLMDRAGGKYVLWPSGIISGSTIAALHLAYAPPTKGAANADWTDTQIFNDPSTSPNGNKIKGGNNSERWFTLSYAGNESVNLIYSKPTEDWRNLYWEIWKNGAQVLGPVAPVKSTTDNKFEWVTGFRNQEVQSGGMFFVWGERDQVSTPKQSGKVTFWRISSTSGRAVSFGTACQGNLSQAPRITVDNVPAPSGSLKVLFDRHPASAPGFLAIGTMCQIPPLDLAFMGVPNCYLDINFPILVVIAVNNAGTLTLPWNIPAGMKPGDKFYIQNFVLEKTANAGGALTSNAMGFLF